MKIFSLKNRYRATSVVALALAFLLMGGSAAYATLTFDATSIVGSTTADITGAAGSAVTMGSATTTGNIAIGAALTSGTLTLSKSTATGNVVIHGAVTAGANTLFNNSTTSTIAIGGALTSGTLTLGNAAATGITTINGSTLAGTNTLFNNSTTSNITIGGALTTGVLTLGSMTFTPGTHPTRDELVVGSAGNNAVIRVYADNANAFDVKGMSATDSASAGAVLDNFMYVSYGTAFNNAYAAGTKRNRLNIGTNYDSDILLQSPHQVRIVAADNTVTGGTTNTATTNGVGNILMISRSDVKISPWALPEAIGNNYLIVSGVTHTVATAANPEGSQYNAGNVTLETNAGDLVMQPLQGYVQLYGNAGKRFETTGTGVTVTGALTATTYVTAPMYEIGSGATFTTATPAPTKAELQQAGFWPVVTTGNTVAIGIPAMDTIDIGRHLTFTVNTGGTNALTVTNGAGMTLVQLVGTGAATSAEDPGDYIDCLITTTATATCITYAKD